MNLCLSANVYDAIVVITAALKLCNILTGLPFASLAVFCIGEDFQDSEL